MHKVRRVAVLGRKRLLGFEKGIPNVPCLGLAFEAFGEKQRRRLGNRAAGALEGQFLHDFAVHLGVDV